MVKYMQLDTLANKENTEEELENLLSMDMNSLFEHMKKWKLAPIDESCLNLGFMIFKSKWKIPIYNLLIRFETMRYGEIKKFLEEYGITNNVLTKTLKEMEEDGLIIRTQAPFEIPPRVEYCLTQSAKEFLYVKLQMSLWVRKHNRQRMTQNENLDR